MARWRGRGATRWTSRTTGVSGFCAARN